MDHAETRPTKLLSIHHLAFEATEEGALRVIAFEEDPDTGSKTVDDIIEFHPGTYRFAHKIISLLERRSLGNVISMSATWDAPISRIRSDENRVRRILKTFPGAEAFAQEQRRLYEARHDDYTMAF